MRPATAFQGRTWRKNISIPGVACLVQYSPSYTMSILSTKGMPRVNTPSGCGAPAWRHARGLGTTPPARTLTASRS